MEWNYLIIVFAKLWISIYDLITISIFIVEVHEDEDENTSVQKGMFYFVKKDMF